MEALTSFSRPDFGTTRLEQARDELAAATSLRERAEQREAAAVQRAEQDLAAALARENSAHAREVNALTKALELAEARIATLTTPAAGN